MSLALYRLGRWSAGRPWIVIGLWLLLGVAVIGASSTFGQDLDDSFDVPGLDSYQATQLLTDAQSEQAGVTARVVMAPLDDDATFFSSPAARASLASAEETISGLANVVGTSPLTTMLAEGDVAAVEAGAISSDGRVAQLVVQYPLVDELGLADLDLLKEALVDLREETGLQVEAGGELFFAFEEPQTGLGEALGLLAAVVVLLVAFGSIIAMGLPIGVALFGLALGVSSMALVTMVIEIPAWAPQIGAMVGLGVGIDYALFLVTRHREFLGSGLTVVEAAGRAVATAGQAVVFAGGTVMIAILGLAVSGVPAVTAAGVATSLIVLIMVVASITLVPAFLGLAGHWINRLAVRRPTEVSANVAPNSGWDRWGRHVSRHAWPYAIGVTAVLIALTAPVFALRLGFPDEGTQPETTTQRRAYDLVASGFGPGANGPLLIAVDLNGDTAVVAALTDAIAKAPGIAGLGFVDINAEAGVATIVALPTTAPQDNETVETIGRLRSDVFPPILDASPATAHVGGQTATFADIAEQVKDRLPIFISAVILLSFVLLMFVFRSILVPLKAAILNLLSIGAAYGVLVAVFQWGWGASLIGLEGTVPIVSFIPMFMFAILFGLSMDYEVFLLSRVRENYLASGDNESSVIHGLASTARVITSAALIMISVFGGFVLGSDPTVKMFGLGLATAILVDATIVRIILVPASMKLLGDANWWLPGWLDRLLPTIDIEGETALPAPEFEPVSQPDFVLDVRPVRSPAAHR